ncbi:unnamed protein product [Caenorhabditis sp. 36 PRJEB53466]|nr:unnamed protein product [Caenorhabditis sp. 36 PRJEB53466]
MRGLERENERISEQLEEEKARHSICRDENVVKDRELVKTRKVLKDCEEKNCYLSAEVLKLTQQLEKTQKSIDHMKRAGLLESLKPSAKAHENVPIGKKEEKAVEHEEKKFGTFAGYTTALSKYKKKRVVSDAIAFLKSGTTTSEDYNELIRSILKRSCKDDAIHFKLSAQETFILRCSLHLSDGALKFFKRFGVEKLGFDILASRPEVSALRKELDRSFNYICHVDEHQTVLPSGRMTTVRSGRLLVMNLENELSMRLTRLEENGRLIFDEATGDDIVCSLAGDKGAEETKVCIAIENTSDANSPDGFILLCVYEGADNADELRLKVSDVFEMFNKMQTITYRTKHGSQTKKVRKHVIGDIKFLSSVYGHQGQSASCPCHICPLSWSYRGQSRVTLEEVDFDAHPDPRTLKTYRRDSQAGSNSVRQNSEPLCDVEPADAKLPTVHLTSGVYEYYFEQWFIGQCNAIDVTSVEINTLREQKKKLARLIKKEKAEEESLMLYSAAADEAHCAATSYNIIMKSPVCHLKKPIRICDSSVCIVNHLSKEKVRDEWVQCDACNKDFHFCCTSVFSPDEKAEVSRETSRYICDECQHLSLHDRRQKAAKAWNALRQRTTELSNVYQTLYDERVVLERSIFQPTGRKRKQYERTLLELGCDTHVWFEAHTGNQIRKVLREESIDKIMTIFPDNGKNRLVKNALYGLAKIMTLSSKAVYSELEIDDIEATVKKFLGDMKKAFAKEPVIPKMHVLGCHLISFLRRHHSWGKCSEQGMEHFHARYNTLKKTFHPVRNVENRTRLMAGEATLATQAVSDDGGNAHERRCTALMTEADSHHIRSLITDYQIIIERHIGVLRPTIVLNWKDDFYPEPKIIHMARITEYWPEKQVIEDRITKSQFDPSFCRLLRTDEQWKRQFFMDPEKENEAVMKLIEPRKNVNEKDVRQQGQTVVQ